MSSPMSHQLQVKNRELMVSGKLRNSGKYKSKPQTRIKEKIFFIRIQKSFPGVKYNTMKGGEGSTIDNFHDL